ncbi:hypothetical protein [Sediminibacterium sp.]|uniref:hypothetical protein n=1 Tax=Sediminibacterium sp. TaxID=1917865 RepID=UPI003F6FACA7
MKKDKFSVHDINNRPINTGIPWIIGVLHNVFLLLTFPMRVFFFFLNPFPTKEGTPRQIKIRK